VELVTLDWKWNVANAYAEVSPSSHKTLKEATAQSVQFSTSMQTFRWEETLDRNVTPIPYIVRITVYERYVEGTVFAADMK
jgi:hypothetical protein